VRREMMMMMMMMKRGNDEGRGLENSWCGSGGWG